MNNHTKKKITPIIITIIALVYYSFYFGVIIKTLPYVYKILLGVIPILLAIVMVRVCIQRLKEIDGGEEDDLSKY